MSDPLPPSREAQTVAEEVVPLVEEIATIEKQEVVTGRVRVRTLTETVEVPVTLRKQRAEVERVTPDANHSEEETSR